MSKANAATGCLHTGMAEPTSRQPLGCNLSCESSAFQGRNIGGISTKEIRLNLSCERHIGPSAGSGTLF